MTNQEAARTAGERLKRIEAWTRRTFYAAAVAAALLAVIAAVVAYVGLDYMRLKGAMRDASARMPPPRVELRR